MFLLRTRSNKKFHGQYFSQGQTARHLLIHNLCMKSAWGVLDAIFFSNTELDQFLKREYHF